MLTKEIYTNAELEVILFQNTDVILTSPGDEYEEEPMTQAP